MVVSDAVSADSEMEEAWDPALTRSQDGRV